MEKAKLVTKMVEGKISNKIYWAPKGKSALEVFRNFQQALSGAGFETLYQCDTAQCEKDSAQGSIVRWAEKANWQVTGDSYIQRIFEYKPGFHYLHSRKNVSTGMVDIQIGLRDAENENDNKGRVQQFIQIVESANIEVGLVTVNAKAISDSLKRDGKIALYGILFDTSKASIKTESNATLEEMAKTLKNDAAIKVFIVGHTDNQGNVEANVNLSLQRAQAVVDVLSKRFGIAADRLQARGVANFSPVANNLDENGRAKNRRVEMVVR
jgi:OOP family OmpA-OmpF porin